MAVCVLYQMQEFDQQIAVARTLSQQVKYFGMSLIFQLTAFGRFAPFAFTGFPNAGLRI